MKKSGLGRYFTLLSTFDSKSLIARRACSPLGPGFAAKISAYVAPSHFKAVSADVEKVRGAAMVKGEWKMNCAGRVRSGNMVSTCPLLMSTMRTNIEAVYT